MYALTAFGFGAGSHVSTGINNSAMGFKALYSNTIGNYNTAYGAYSLNANTTAAGNTACGMYALSKNTTGDFNTACGSYSLYLNTTGAYNTSYGKDALAYNTTGYDNVANGYNALIGNTTGGLNTGDGYVALGGNTTGINNTAVGAFALINNAGSLGSYNTAVGGTALGNTTNSQYNTAIGYDAGYKYDNGYNNTIIGANSDLNAPGLYNCIALGELVTCTASSQARIGNSFTNSIGGYVSWTNISDGRFKKDIKEEVKGLDFIMKLRPVTYHLDISGISKKLGESRGKEMDASSKLAIVEKEKILFSGFVAQEVEQAAKETGYDFSGVDKPKNANDFYGLRYAEFVVPLVKAVQELSLQNTELKKQVDDLQERMKRLESSFVTKK